MTLPEKIRDYVKSECQKETNVFGMEAFDDHFVSMVKHAKFLAEKNEADIEIVEIAGWLHDIASIRGDYEDHHIKGAEYAEEILSKHNYPEEKIEQIKHCIIAHRGSKEIPRETIEAKCISDADAMSHFDNIGSLFYLAHTNYKMNTEEANTFVRDKLERSWNKLTPQAKEIVRPKYEATKELLS